MAIRPTAKIDQVPMYPAFWPVGQGKVYDTLQDAAGTLPELTVNPNYELQSIARVRSKRLTRRLESDLTFERPTLFKEVMVVLRPFHLRVEKLLGTAERQKWEISLDQAANMLSSAVAGFLEKHWDGEKANVFLHSSGYDTRLISVILKRLSEECGDGWLGELRLICLPPETEMFKRVMECVGWPSEWVMPIQNEEGGWTDLHAEAMRFENVGQWCSDVRRLVLYANGFLVKKLIEDLFSAKRKKDIRIITGIYSDESLKRHGRSVAGFIVRYMHDIHWEFGGYDPLEPYTSAGWMDVIWNHDFRIRDYYGFKRKMIALYDRELAEIPAYPANLYEPIKFSREIMARMQADCDKSWWSAENGKRIELPADNTMCRGNYPAWKPYFKAAICEEMIRRGCRVRMER